MTPALLFALALACTDNKYVPPADSAALDSAARDTAEAGDSAPSADDTAEASGDSGAGDGDGDGDGGDSGPVGPSVNYRGEGISTGVTYTGWEEWRVEADGELVCRVRYELADALGRSDCAATEPTCEWAMDLLIFGAAIDLACVAIGWLFGPSAEVPVHVGGHTTGLSIVHD